MRKVLGSFNSIGLYFLFTLNMGLVILELVKYPYIYKMFNDNLQSDGPFGAVIVIIAALIPWLVVYFSGTVIFEQWKQKKQG